MATTLQESRPTALTKLQRGDGAVELGLSHTDGRTRLSHLYQRAPAKLLMPDPAPGDPLTAVIATISGGLTGGDRLSVSVKAGQETEALVTTQAAERIYRSVGPDVEMEIEIEVDRGRLEWLPQETILFDGAKLRRRTHIRAEAGATILAGDMVTFGRRARGERFHTGALLDSWRVTRAGKLIWADGLCLGPEPASMLEHPAGLAGAAAFASMVVVADNVQPFKEVAQKILSDVSVFAGVTEVNSVLLLRMLDEDATVLRDTFGGVWCRMRHEMFGFPARLPRLWYC